MDAIRTIVRKHWGHDSLRPLQAEAMQAALDRRDSLVVLPTGGGKSLCYQAPALLSDSLTVVVSPLIALMKDQVDGLLSRDVPAAFFNSSLDTEDRRRVTAGISNGEFRLLFVSPERFAGEGFYNLLHRTNVGSFAIDEAHCISHWGHDFRGDYRQLGRLKRLFPKASVHAFTATATPRVRADIIDQLRLDHPVVLVGDFFRPNLTYRLFRRRGGFEPILNAVLERKGNAGIVYCMRRVDVDELASQLLRNGIRAAGYHAGMDDEERTRVQDAFAIGETDVIAATVAFGMGIDRKDIRFVIHAAMPKSIEHYQQETGRAGRDGKPAECLLFYSGGDFHTWKTIIEKENSDYQEGHLQLLGEMYNFCSATTCRHRRLVTYFGQEWERSTCGACDVCAGDLQRLPDATIIAQKILSCVARTGQRFGAGHIADVLMGLPTDKVMERGHHELSTFGLITDQPKPVLMGWIDQLVEQQLLIRDGEYRVLMITPAGWEVMRSQREAMLCAIEVSDPKRTRRKRSARSTTRGATSKALPPPAGPARKDTTPIALDPPGRELFEKLRALRKQIADENEIPAFMVFSDKTLRAMAHARPQSSTAMLAIKGVGMAKWEAFGQRFVSVIRTSSTSPDASRK